MFSSDPKALSREESREFFETAKSTPKTKTQAPVFRSELVNPTFWTILFAPPITVGIALLLAGWLSSLGSKIVLSPCFRVPATSPR
jgi:hypothetical protein